MTDNATPPTTPVPVQRAVLGLWLSWLIGFVRLPVQFYDPALQEQMKASIPLLLAQEGMETLNPETVEQWLMGGAAIVFGIVFFVSLGITAFILRKVKQGRDWARIVCLIWGALSAVGLFKLDGFDLNTGLTLAYLALGYSALYLLFTEPGALWFRKKTIAAEAADAKW